VPSAHGTLDPGSAYASNISLDSKGRTILWLWGRTGAMMFGQPAQPDEKAWAGVITMPRVLSIGADGYLVQQPIPEFETLRGPVHSVEAQAIDKPSVLGGISTNCAEIEAVFTGSGTCGLELRRSVDGKPGVVVSVQSSYQGAFLNVGNVRTFLTPAEQYKLRIFLDKRCIEVFANDGVAAVYNYIDAPVSDTGIAVFGQPAPPPRFPGGRLLAGFSAPKPPRLESLKVWPMKGADFSLEHFHV
jgi:beta-fructofuranosidase